MNSPMTITRLVPWFGANAANAALPARMLADCSWVYIPFAGSMCEVPHFGASVQLMVSDMHDELIALARVVRDREQCSQLASNLSDRLFHPAELERALMLLRSLKREGCSLFGLEPSERPHELTVAEAYFIVAWMGRSGVSGTRGEDRVGLALRYDAGGGDPVTRYRSAVESLAAWQRALERCSFTREDAFEVLARLKKKVTSPVFEPTKPGNRIGVYCDPPWPDDGDGYLHRFSEADQRTLARALLDIPHARIVVRFGDHPLIRELYPESAWTWVAADGRTQVGGKAEVFLEKRA